MKSLIELCAAGGAIAVLAQSVTLEAQTSTNVGLKATVGVQGVLNKQTGSSSGSGVSTDLTPGETKRLNLTAGKGGDLCVTGIFASETGTFPPDMQARVDQQLAAALYAWTFDITMLEVAIDRIVFDLTWERTSRATPATSLRRTQRLTLKPGESHPVDLVHGAQTSDCQSVIAEMVADVVDDRNLQATVIEWDLWLQGPQSSAAHRAVTTLQGERASFRFEHLPITGTDPNGNVNTLAVEVYGDLRGRLRADGSIDVALGAFRGVNSGQNRMRPPRLFSPKGNYGQKYFQVKPGEAIKIVLPPIDSTPPVQFRTDPVTGNRTVRAVPKSAQSASSSDPNEMSITVQARVR